MPMREGERNLCIFILMETKIDSCR